MTWLLAGAGIGLVWIAAVACLIWWTGRPIKTPAGGEPPAIPRAAGGRPPPGPLHRAHDIHYREAPCGCFELINHVKGRRHTWRCDTHAFEAHWEERLRQS